MYDDARCSFVVKVMYSSSDEHDDAQYGEASNV